MSKKYSKEYLKKWAKDNYERYKEEGFTKNGEAEISPWLKRYSGIGKGDMDRSIKRKYEQGYDLINWRSKENV